MVVLLIGQQGAGKSTLGNALRKAREVRFVSGGALIRREIARETPIGLEIERPINAGERIPPKLMYELLAQELEGNAAEDLILDGFPLEAREHGELVDVVGDPALVLLLGGVPTDELVQRVERRLECPKCYAPFREAERKRCPRCRAGLRRRPEDDDVAKIALRHGRWAAAEAALVDLYQRLGILAHVDARGSRDEVKSHALQLFDTRAKARR